MECPYCTADSQVVDSRSSADGIRRRRVCVDCKRRFTTYEKLAPPSIKVQKRDGGSEPFDSKKLVRVLTRVCKGRPNVAEGDISRVARAIEADLLDERARSVSSGEVVRRLLARLKGLDSVAYDRLSQDYLDENGQLRVGVDERDEDGGQLGLFPTDD